MDGDKSKVAKAESGLTVIDKLKNYFGIALRSKIGDLKNMQNAILASLFRVASSESNQYHEYCPKTPDCWCQYQLDVLNKTNIFTLGAGLSDDIIHTIKRVYSDLTKTEALQQYGHIVEELRLWERAHQNVYCELDTLAVFDAVANYNYGRKANLDILKHMNIITGVLLQDFVILWNYNEIIMLKITIHKLRNFEEKF